MAGPVSGSGSRDTECHGRTWPWCRGLVGGRNTQLGRGRLVAADAAASGVVWRGIGWWGWHLHCALRLSTILGTLEPFAGLGWGGPVGEVEGLTCGCAGLYMDGVPMVRVDVCAGWGAGEQGLEYAGGEGHKVGPFFESRRGDRYGGTQVVREGRGQLGDVSDRA